VRSVGRLKYSEHIWIERKVIRSRAFLSLRGVAPQVLFLLMTRRQMEMRKGNGKRKAVWHIKNNGQIILSYREVEKKYGISQKRFTRAIDELIEHGFISVASYGGGLFGTPSKYSFIDAWQSFGTPDFKCEQREKRAIHVGFCKKCVKTTDEKDGGTAIAKGGG